MKKITFLMLLIMPCFVYAEDIVIETVSIENNDNVIEVREPVINGINIDLDLKFNEVGSSITYKLGLKNKSDDDYEIEDKVISSENDNIEYTYTCEDGNRIKSRRSKTCYVKAEYKNRVTNAVLMANNLSVKEEKELNIDLIGKEIINPKTGYIDMIGLILLLIIFSVLLYYYSNNKVIKNSYIIVLAMILIVLPESYALKTVTLTINSNIEITDNTRRCSHTPRNLKEFIMCELETDLGDSLNELYQDEINNPEKYNLTNEKVNEIRSFLDTYNKSIKMLNWNNDPVTQPTEQNYRNYKEGMYINGYRSMPIFKKSSLDDYSNFTSDCIPLIEIG